MLGDAAFLRDARSDDAGPVIRLLRRSWLTTWAPELPFEAVRHFVENDPASSFVAACLASFRIADVEGSICGMCYVSKDVVESLHVDPVAKGRGLGTVLLADAEAAIGRYHPSARLEVRAFNDAARAFYQARGWVERRRYEATECGVPVATLELGKDLAPEQDRLRPIGP